MENQIKTLPKELQILIGEYNVHHRNMMRPVFQQLFTIYLDKHICTDCLSFKEECICIDSEYEDDDELDYECGYDSDGYFSRFHYNISI